MISNLGKEDLEILLNFSMLNLFKYSSIPTRVITACVILPLFILVVWTGSQFNILFLTFATALTSGIGSWEINKIIGKFGVKTQSFLTIPISVALVSSSYFYDTLYTYYFSGITLLALLLLVLTPNIMKYSKFHNLLSVLLPIFIPAGFLLYAPLLMQSNLGLEKFVFMFLIVFTFDTFALTFGKLFGTHKLIPSISPNKTWEGVIGGTISSLILSTFLFYFDLINFVTSIPIYYILTLSIVVAAQLGDISISRIKRMSNLKDTSSILPGHGGILDRLDSILFSLLIMHYFIRIN